MALPSSTAPLRAAVRHALSAVTGKFRAIPQAYLFKLARPNPRGQRAETLKGAPAAWVEVRDVIADPTRLYGESSDRRALVVTVAIVCEYYAGSEDFNGEHIEVLERIEADRLRVIDALLAPGSLLTAPSGAETGLDGDGCLRWDGYRSIGPESATPKNRVLRVTHLFRATMEVAKATS
jgi:hypothetical protein